MTKSKEINYKNKAPTQPKKVELTTLKGITTYQINQALKAKSPYPARVFLKLTTKYCQYCQASGQKECGYYNENCSLSLEDIPIFFRIKENNSWIRPKIKKGSYLQVEGKWTDKTNGSDRKSFTAYSYQLLNSQFNQEIEISHDK